MPSTRDTALKIFEGLVKTARGIREQGSEVEPMGFLFVPVDGSFGLVQVPMGRLPSKDAAAAVMKNLAQQVGASYAVHITEAWTVDLPGAEVSEDDRLAASAWVMAGNSLEDYPDAVEVLMASIDGPDLNRMVFITINRDGSLTEGEIVDAVFKGRFTNLSGRVGED